MSTTPTDDDLALVDALGAVAFAITAALTKLGAQHDLSLTQLRLIGILRDRTMTITELANALGLDRSSVSGLVDRTEQRGLVHRQPNPADARSVHVTVSPAGTDAFALGAAEILSLLTPMTEALTPPETRRLTTLLERMLDHRGLGTAPPAPRP